MVEKIVVGSEEWCGLPDMGIPAIKARIDSGAKTSSLHAVNINPIMRDNKQWVSFEVHPVQQNRDILIRFEAEVVDIRKIKNTGGVGEKRYVIKQTLSLGDYQWDIELTLANRDSMGYRMLLGREAMIDRVLIDPAGSMHIAGYTPTQIEHFYAPYREPKRGLKLGLLASKTSLYTNQRFIEAAEERGHRMDFLNIRHCSLKLDKVESNIYHKNAIIKSVDAIVPRIRTSLLNYGCGLLRQFEMDGTLVLNKAKSIAQTVDSLQVNQLLLRSGLTIPTTVVAHAPQNAAKLSQLVGGAPLVVKLLDNKREMSGVLAETQKASESTINAFKGFKANMLIQEYLKDSNGKAVRCIVLGGKVVIALERVAAQEDFRMNHHINGEAKVVKITSQERRDVLKVARISDLNFAGIDFVRTNDGPVFFGIVASPSLYCAEKATGKDLASLVIIELERRLGWERELVNPST